MPIIPVFREQRQENQKIKVILGNIISLRQAYIKIWLREREYIEKPHYQKIINKCYNIHLNTRL